MSTGYYKDKLTEEWKEFRILMRSIPAAVVTLFVVSVICMSLLANKTLLQLDWIALDGGILISWLSFMCMDIITKHFGPGASNRISVLASAINLLTCMTTAPLRILTWFGILASGCGFLLSLYIIIRRFFIEGGNQWAGEGVFTLFAVMFVFTGIQMIGIGMIGEYVGRIYTDVRNRPRYFIEEVIGRKDEE
jgi:hypothetical protein